MRENEFGRFLVQDSEIESKDKAVRSRISKAKRVERDLGINLDTIVRDDRTMYNTLKEIKARLNDTNGAYQNAIRKYYIFINKVEFPSINEYERLYL